MGKLRGGKWESFTVAQMEGVTFYHRFSVAMDTQCDGWPCSDWVSACSLPAPASFLKKHLIVAVRFIPLPPIV